MVHAGTRLNIVALVSLAFSYDVPQRKWVMNALSIENVQLPF